VYTGYPVRKKQTGHVAYGQQLTHNTNVKMNMNIEMDMDIENGHGQ
jgi:hypothetical protein